MATYEQTSSWRAQTEENAARHAFAWTTFRTTGWGETVFEDTIDFGLIFVELPMVSYGYVFNPDEDPEIELVDSRFPKPTGGVYRWRQNQKGLYVGAVCMVNVDTLSPEYVTEEDDPGYVLQHHFQFSGIAIKDIHPGDSGDD